MAPRIAAPSAPRCQTCPNCVADAGPPAVIPALTTTATTASSSSSAPNPSPSNSLPAAEPHISTGNLSTVQLIDHVTSLIANPPSASNSGKLRRASYYLGEHYVANFDALIEFRRDGRLSKESEAAINNELRYLRALSYRARLLARMADDESLEDDESEEDEKNAEEAQILGPGHEFEAVMSDADEEAAWILVNMSRRKWME